MASDTSIISRVKRFSHQAADELCHRILGQPSGPTVVIDLNAAEDASTAAFARLVLLRRELLRDGRDLRLRGLRHRAADVWRVNRLNQILPSI